MAKKVVRLTESDLKRIVRRVIKEQITGANIKDCMSKKLQDMGMTQDIDTLTTCLSSIELGTDMQSTIPEIIKCSKNLTFDKGVKLFNALKDCTQSSPEGTMSLTKSTETPEAPSFGGELPA